MWTKRQLVEEAYAELALAGYVFDITPEEQQTALRRLDTMLAAWEVQGIQLGYALPANPNDSDLDQESGLPDVAVETVYLQLAMRLAPGAGKQLSPDTLRTARQGLQSLLSAAAARSLVPSQQPGWMPRGGGNRRWWPNRSPFFCEPRRDPLPVDCGGDMTIPEE